MLRNACSCKRRKEALSPSSVSGRHESLGQLPERIVEQIHAIVSDPGRLTRKWFEAVLASGTSDAEYVEIVGVMATVVSIDTFCRAIGVPAHPLPQPEAGAPHRRRPKTAHQRGEAWVPMIHPKDLEGELETEEERVLANYWAGALRQHPPCTVARARRSVRLVRAGRDPIPSRQMDAGFRERVSRDHACADRADCRSCLSPQSMFLLNHLACGLAP